jgi:hypothetical protein
MTRSSGDVFRDLGFAPEEAANLRVRSMLMIEIEKYVRAKRLTIPPVAPTRNSIAIVSFLGAVFRRTYCISEGLVMPDESSGSWGQAGGTNNRDRDSLMSGQRKAHH